jgi:putative PEP-CTERM system histidine kinase
MTEMPGVVALAAAVVTAALAAGALARRPRGLVRWSFAGGMLLLAAEAVATHALVVATESPEDRLLWLTVQQALGSLVPVPWALFVARLALPEELVAGRRVRLGLIGLTVVGAGAVLGGALGGPFLASEIPGPFYAAQLSALGSWIMVYQLLAGVALLAGLEVALRSSRGAARWRTKYLVLGLAGIFLARFYFVSLALLFQVVLATYLATQAATLAIGAVVIGASVLRGQLRTTEFAPSRHVVYRSVAAGALGLYLVAIGALGWALGRLGIPEELFWISLVVFVSAIALAALLLSESLRWRVKRYLLTHFHRSKYDYREQWSRFTARLTSLVEPRELLPELLETVTEAMGATFAVIYIVDERDGTLRTGASGGRVRPSPTLALDPALRARLARHRIAFALADGGVATPPDVPAREMAALLELPEAALLAPLVWRDSLLGLIVLGPERTGAPYGHEDLEFLSTVAEQAAGALTTARLSKGLAEAREFEAFHRLTSFVLHDVKNAISALTLLAQNAEKHFADPEFRGDAIRTLGRTAQRMRSLMSRLTSARESPDLDTREVDLATLVRETLAEVNAPPRIEVVPDLQPVGPIQGDPEVLRRVLVNLLTNAIEAMVGEGVLTVKTHEGDRHAVLVVADTGCGMSEEFLRESLFTPFRTTKPSGWGVGLFQVKGMVEAHGGAIEVESQMGKGTTFTIRIPHDGPRQ